MSEDQKCDEPETSAGIKISENGETEVKIAEKPLDLDDVLINELGEFGWYQLRNIILIAGPIIICGLMAEYIFSAAAIPHRCRIPECGEDEKLHDFNPDWILNAVPQSSAGFASCQRYAPRELQGNGSLEYCPDTLFDQSSIIDCEGFVYARDNTVVYDFDLGCQEWLRVLAGTFYTLGSLFSLPIAGYISDRFGRRFILVISIVNAGVIGFIRAFSVNYTMYVILQFLQNFLGGGAYSSAYILVTELVGPKYRVLTSATSSAIFATGQVIFGGVAWLISPWRYLIMAVNIPGFFVISYYWILTDSVRWMLSKKKYTEARKTLKTVARVNKTHISEKSLCGLMNSQPSDAASNNTIEKEILDLLQKKSPVQLVLKLPLGTIIITDKDSTVITKKTGLIRNVLKSPVLFRRVCTTPIWWITMTFVYYGLSINSVSLSDTIYLNFILTCAIEIPGFYTAVLFLDRIGRKPTLSVGFFFSAACNIAFVFIPSDFTVLRLVIYLLGKFGISTVVTSLYLYTTELYPTEFRHSLLGFSSMIGRIGSITTQLTPALMVYWHGIPSLLFAGLGILSGLLVVTQPETLGTKLPDTLAEAEALGTAPSKMETSSANDKI